MNEKQQILMELVIWQEAWSNARRNYDFYVRAGRILPQMYAFVVDRAVEEMALELLISQEKAC